MNNIIMKLEDIDKFYMETGNKLHILKKLNLEVKRGEFVSILGKSGSGKSTLLNIMGLLDKIDGGKIWIDDKEVSSLNETERNNDGKLIGFFSTREKDLRPVSQILCIACFIAVF